MEKLSFNLKEILSDCKYVIYHNHFQTRFKYPLR